MASTVEQLKETIDGVVGAFEEFKKENDKQINLQVKEGVRQALGEAKLTNINEALEKLNASREDLEKRFKEETDHNEKLEKELQELRKGANAMTLEEAKKQREELTAFNLSMRTLAIRRQMPQPKEATVEELNSYKKGFRSYMTRDIKVMTPEDQYAMQVGVDPDGGYTVPPDVSGRIITALYELSPIRQIASVQNISSDRLDGYEDLGEASCGWVSETDPRPTTANPQLGKWEIVAQELYASPQATQRILDDSAIDIEGWLAKKVADKFARVEGAAFVAGTGVGQPRGFTTYPTAATADNTRAWGTFQHIATGTSGGFAADPAGGDVLFDLIAAFRPPLLNRARFVTLRAVLAKIRKFKATTGNYLWQPGLTIGMPDSILGYPVVNSEDMPALGANSLSLAFGDFSEGYQIVDRLGIRTLRDPYTNKPYVIFYTTKRVGGGALNFQAIKFVKFI
jgi:HK97 family phage major capsid protein